MKQQFVFAAALAALATGGAAQAGYGFGPSLDVTPKYSGVGTVAVADMDGDGLDDVVSLVYGDQSPVGRRLLLHRSLPGGGFAAPEVIDFGASEGYWGYSPTLQLADVDRDGRNDMIVSGMSNPPYTLQVVLNRPGGRVVVSNPLVTGGYRGVAVDDLNGDGHLDLLTVPGAPYTVAMISGRGNGVFDYEQVLPVPEYSGFPQLADIDGDGRRDLVITIQGRLVARLRTPFGFAAGYRTLLPLAPGASGMFTTTGDFNGDERTDVAAFRAGHFLLNLQGADGNFRNKQPGGPLMAGHRHAAVDLDGDGRDDHVALGNDVVEVRMGTATGWAPAVVTQVGQANGMAFGDVDGDGFVDLVLNDYYGRSRVMHGRPAIDGVDLGLRIDLSPAQAVVHVANHGATASTPTYVIATLASRGGLQPADLPKACAVWSDAQDSWIECDVPAVAPGADVSFALPFLRDAPARADHVSANATMPADWVDARRDNDATGARLRVAPSP